MKLTVLMLLLKIILLIMLMVALIMLIIGIIMLIILVINPARPQLGVSSYTSFCNDLRCRAWRILEMPEDV